MKSFILFLLAFGTLAASSDDADVLFLVYDLKYSEADGVKVCEVQPGILSAYNGDRFVTGGNGVIPKNFCQFLDRYPWKIWSAKGNVSDKGVRAILRRLNKYSSKTSFSSLVHDPIFLKNAKRVPKTRSSLNNYSGILIAKAKNFSDVETFKQDHPGILVLDASSFPFWRDKLKMTELFKTAPILEAIKPRWGVFEKNYTKTLAQEILKQIPSKRLVIKPRGAWLGKGVIILEAEELDGVLKTILGDKEPLKDNPDRGFNYWAIDPFNSFIVEEFFASDLITVPHLSKDPYQPTLRVALLSIFENGGFRVEFLGGYWSTPPKTVYEPGTLTDKNKCESSPPFYHSVQPAIMKTVQDTLREATPFLHQAMLEN